MATDYDFIIRKGNLGVGTPSPSQKLDVAGSTRIQGNIQLTGQATGYETAFNGSSIYSAASTFNGESSMFGALVLQSRGDSGRPIVLVTGTTPTERMRITDAGNVGIGTTSPSQKLHLYGSGNQLMFIENTGTYHMYTGLSSNVGIVGSNNATPLSLQTNGVSRVYLDTGGNVGIGNSSPSGRVNISNALGANAPTTVTSANSYLHLGNSDYGPNNNGKFMIAFGYVGGSPNTNAPAYIGFEETNTGGSTKGALTFYTRDVITDTAPTERLYIASNGYVGIGTTSPSYPLHVSGSSGGISIYATNDIAAFSDESVKTELQIIDGAIDRIKQINGYTYVRIDDSSNIRRAGVIAQEVQKVLPEVVSKNEDGTLNVAYSNMIALLVEGIKEQQSQIDTLNERIKLLER